MSTVIFAAGTASPFAAASDSLSFTDVGDTAADLEFAASGADLAVGLHGQSMTLLNTSYASLRSSSLSFANGSKFAKGSAGVDTLSGSAAGDYFDLTAGGSDSASGGDGDDVFVLAASLNANDRLTGGGGNDTLRLSGTYAASVVFGAGTVTGIEQFQIGAGTVRLTLHQGILDGVTGNLSFIAAGQGAGDAFVLDASMLVVPVPNPAAADLIVTGGPGNDWLSTGGGSDVVAGGGGDDTVLGGGGRDRLQGGDGDDSLVGGAGIDTLRGDSGRDRLDGGLDNDALFGGDGRDILVGGDGRDALTGGMDSDTLTGGASEDTFAFGFGNPRSESSQTTIDFITDFSTGDRLDLPGINFINNLPLAFVAGATAFRTDAQSFAAGNLGVRPGSNPGDGFVDVLWRYSAGLNRVEVWVDGNDDGQFSEVDTFVLMDSSVGGKTSLSAADLVDNLIAWRGTGGGDTLGPGTPGVNVAAGNLAYGLAGNDALDGAAGTDTLFGGLGNDSLLGGDGDDELHGGSGADVLDGGTGSDTLDAEGADSASSAGSDAAGTVNVLNGGAGDDVLRGGAGDDQLNGQADADELYGDDGADVLDGGDGDDVLDGGAGSDVVNGGAGADTLHAGSTASAPRGWYTDVLDAGAGDDAVWLWASDLNAADRSVVTGGLGADRIHLHLYDQPYYNFTIDTLSPVFAPDRITDFRPVDGDALVSGLYNGLGGLSGGVPVVWRGAAQAGFTAAIGQSTALASGGAVETRFLELWTMYDAGTDTTRLFMDRDRSGAVDAFDLLLEFGGRVVLGPANFSAGTYSVKVGSAGNDTDTNPPLGNGDDIGYGLAGNDTLDGRGGADSLSGDEGNDSLVGGLGDDSLYGGADNDVLTGGDGVDLLHGGAGSDTIDGGADADVLYADGESDGAGTYAVFDGTGTVNVLNGGTGNDYLMGGAGDDQLNGQAGDDTLYGDDGADQLLGGDGNDSLEGGAGNDLVDGGAGADVLFAGSTYSAARGAHTDVLVAGAGDDTVWLWAYDMYRADRNVVTAGAGADRIVLHWQYQAYYNFTIGELSPVSATDRITDFDAAEGDVLVSGIVDGLGGVSGSLPLVWRGAALAGFTAAIGQSTALASGGVVETRFLEMWTVYDAGTDTTRLFMDRDRGGAVDAADLLLEFDGRVALGPASFSAGTFAAKAGTAGDDADTSPPLGDGSDIGYGLAGNDTLDGRGGDDSLSGDEGDDSLTGGLGDDSLYGDGGDDVLVGGAGLDQLHGGAGSDTLDGGDDADVLYADGASDGAGSAAVVDSPGTVNVLAGGAGDDVLQGGAGDDQLDGQGDNDSLYGEDGADTLVGDDGDDVLEGGAGSDVVDGGAGADTLYAGSTTLAARGTHTDVLDAGIGDDTLWLWAPDLAWADRSLAAGGAGADQIVLHRPRLPDFNFTSDALSPVSAMDRITDFDAAEGDVLVSGIVDGLGGPGGSIPLVWRGAAQVGFTAVIGQSTALASGGAVETRFLELWTVYDPGTDTTRLFMDRDRSGAVDAADLLLEFDGLVALGPASFSAGTFAAKVGTAGDDADTGTPLGEGSDIGYGLAGNDTLDGRGGDDNLSGDEGNDSLIGGLGNDSLYGDGDDDVVVGGGGVDQLHGGTGSDMLDGGDDADYLYADGADDGAGIRTVHDSAGTVNVLVGGAGDDVLQGGTGDDQLSGQADDDALAGYDGADLLDGGDGDDVLDGGAGGDVVIGGAGADLLYAGSSTSAVRGTYTDTLDAGAGDDDVWLWASDPNWADRSVVTGGAGADRIHLHRQSLTFFNFTNGPVSPVAATDLVTDFHVAEGDLLVSGITDGLGADSADVPMVWRGAAQAGFTAAAGQAAPGEDLGLDVLQVWSFYDPAIDQSGLYMDRNRSGVVDTDDFKLMFDGNVALGVTAFSVGTFVGASGLGTGASDDLVGTAAGDILVGGAGDDRIAGLGGNDRIQGDAGNDALDGGDQNDIVSGNAGNDTLLGGGGDDILDGGPGADSLSGGSGNDSLFASQNAGDAAGTVNWLLGGSGVDNLYGSGGDDRLFGDADDDFLFGGDGADRLVGGAGADLMYGGAGNDRITYSPLDTEIDGGADVDLLVVLDAAAVAAIELGNADDQTAGDQAVVRQMEGADFSALTAGVVFSGSGGADWLIGTVQPDALAGAGGDDSLQGGAGNDTLQGGDGSDTAVFAGARGASSIERTGDDAFRVTTGSEVDVIAGIERVQFSDQTLGLTTGGVSLSSAVAVEDELLSADTSALVNPQALSITATQWQAFAGGVWIDIVGAVSSSFAPGDDQVGRPLRAVVTFGDAVAQGQRAFTAATAAVINVNDAPSGAVLVDDTSPQMGQTLLASHTLADADGLGPVAYRWQRSSDGLAWTDIDGATGAAFTVAADQVGALLRVVAGYTDLRGTAENVASDPTEAVRIAINVIDGTAGADNLVGTDGPDQISGLGANDTLDGGNANDILSGGDGNDTLRPGAGDDVVDGGLGRDTLTYADLAAAVVVDLALVSPQPTAGSGVETVTGVENVHGGSGNDTLLGSGGGNVIVGNGGSDLLAGRGGTDSLFGGDGDDLLRPGIGNDFVDGGPGTDLVSYADASGAISLDLSLVTPQVTGGGGTDTIQNVEAAEGSLLGDLLIGTVAGDLLLGIAGDDTLVGGGGGDTLQGGNGNDTLRPGAGDDTVDGGPGKDTVSYSDLVDAVAVDLAQPAAQDTGGGGFDTLVSIDNAEGGGGADILQGAAGANVLVGLAGNDRLIGLGGNDVLDGGEDDDVLAPGVGNDTVDGGNGSDTVSYAELARPLTVDLGAIGPQDTLGAGTEVLAGVENVEGGTRADTLLGDAGSNRLAGNAGNDRLDGRAGADVLIGGIGADTFVFSAPPGAADADGIVDFVPGIDRIEFSVGSGHFGDLAAGPLAAAALDNLADGVGPTAATRIVYDPGSGTLYFDADGIGGLTAEPVAVLQSLPPGLQSSDLLGGP